MLHLDSKRDLELKKVGDHCSGGCVKLAFLFWNRVDAKGQWYLFWPYHGSLADHTFVGTTSYYQFAQLSFPLIESKNLLTD